jgi:hypothetical protein
MAGILPATLNHEALDLGIVSESNQRAAGIRRPVRENLFTGFERSDSVY